MIIKGITALIKKDFVEIEKSPLFYILIIIWAFASLLVGVYIFTSDKGNTIILLVYKYISELTYVSIIFYIVPAIIIPLDFENKMVYIFKNINLRFYMFFLSKIISIIIFYTLLIAISFLSFFIMYISFHFHSLTMGNLYNIAGAFTKIYIPLLFILLPVTAFIVLMAYIFLKRSDSIIIASFLFVVSSYFLGTLIVGYQINNEVGHTAFYSVPYLLYPVLLISPMYITGFIAETLKIPDVNEIIIHSKNGSRILINPPFFNSFLHFYGYLQLVLLIFVILIVIAYFVARRRFEYE